LPPGQIVPALADRGVNIGSERSFYQYNHQHRHNDIRFVTPAQRHSCEAEAICRRRARVYEQARQSHPRRWSCSTRCWYQPEVVWINPPPPEKAINPATLDMAA
jgi:hypothetical protein